MSKKTFTKLGKKEQDAIKEDYLAGVPMAEIARKHNISRTSIQYHAKQKWTVEKSLLKAELFREFSSSKREDFVNISVDAITIMRRCLKAMAENPIPPTVMEAKRASEILVELDKITRLDDNKPTDITEERPITVIELKKKMAVDPFAVIEEVDYEESKDS
tara:strand:- start:1700 stop:2182 length:483 start_codon:yes stop_codon:yes gene_type:complete